MIIVLASRHAVSHVVEYEPCADPDAGPGDLHAGPDAAPSRLFELQLLLLLLAP